jgi:hypothetical protein
MFMLGNLARECGVVDRLSDTMQNALINTVTIFLGLGVGSKLLATRFLNLETGWYPDSGDDCFQHWYCDRSTDGQANEPSL